MITQNLEHYRRYLQSTSKSLHQCFFLNLRKLSLFCAKITTTKKKMFHSSFVCSGLCKYNMKIILWNYIVLRTYTHTQIVHLNMHMGTDRQLNVIVHDAIIYLLLLKQFKYKCTFIRVCKLKWVHCQSVCRWGINEVIMH